MYCKMEVATRLGGVLLLLWLHCFQVSCDVNYDYKNGPNGPTQWGNLNPPKWVLCKTGTNQSPINITSDSIVRQPPNSLGVVYKTTLVDAKIYNNGHTPTVEIVDQNFGVLTISGVMYHLEDFHFHIPSEHLILNHRFSMELHLVHTSTSGKVAVIALLYNLGSTNEFLSQFFSNLPSFTTPNEKKPIKIKLPVFQHNPYYRYIGSLTTPPCNESVVWTIINDFPTLSTQQLQQLRAALPEENARPTQLRNERKVYLFPLS